ncbi:MAG: hypothetical protein V1735_07555 [Nanoarchaeota archaeon]
MALLTDLEKEIVLKLFKEFHKDYNSSSIAREIGKSRVGAFKALRSLETKGFVKGKLLGKARFYTLNLESSFTRKTVELLLMEEANQKQRWVDEFRGLFPSITVATLFGSMIHNEKVANDIDLLLVYPETKNAQVNDFLKEKNEILLKRIHPVKQTKEDLENNLKRKDAVVLDALRTGVVLHGFQEWVEMIAHVASKRQG